MHIGIDLRLHAYAPGGISRYARHLAVELSRLLDPGELTLIPHRREQPVFHLEGTRLYRAWTPPHHRWERYALGTELLPLGLDLLHTTDFIPPAWGARHIVITVHDLNFLHYPQYLTVEARRYYNDQIGWAVERADAILADSYATQRDMVDLLGVAPERISVVHLAAGERFKPLLPAAVQPVLERYGLEPGYLLFVGTWEPRKNLPGLLEALALLHAAGEERLLVIAGRPGWLYDDIFALVQHLKLERWVRFIERPTGDELVSLYNGALALVLPSFYEGFGLTALEALQCGTPAVVSDRASLPEVVGDAGILIDPDDPSDLAGALQRLANDAELRHQLREAGFQQAQKFTWQAVAQKTWIVYKHIVGELPGG